ncbi:hypothetical protein ACFXAF_30485 [Kitasatospora sp. NPDC059463]|uniref:hypothetical protein n=1 Tax=unclassified Kitasatospora TaxID=2633591 RepID=UPI0036BF1170
MPIRRTATGETTTTSYNAAALRILLRVGFEEAPGPAEAPGELVRTEPVSGPAAPPRSR